MVVFKCFAYDIAQPDVVSCYQFAGTIFIEAKRQGYPLKLECLNKLTSNEYPTVAERPKNSELDYTKLESYFEFKLESWRKVLLR